MFNFAVMIVNKKIKKVNIFLMNNSIEKDDQELINKINLILNDFENFEKLFVNDRGDIVIMNKINRKSKRNNYILTNVFKQIIGDDIKKNRV